MKLLNFWNFFTENASWMKNQKLSRKYLIEKNYLLLWNFIVYVSSCLHAPYIHATTELIKYSVLTNINFSILIQFIKWWMFGNPFDYLNRMNDNKKRNKFNLQKVHTLLTVRCSMILYLLWLFSTNLLITSAKPNVCTTNHPQK